MEKTRKIRKVLISQPTLEGAGVHLHRGFGFREVPMFDPFLMFDDFRQDDPAKYLPGFPWHPHRGIETITYMLRGTAEHGDSMGNNGVIGPGDVQWMTAGSGIIHQEMPKGGADGRMGGFQLWANLPASQKMMDPRYRDVKRRTSPRSTCPAASRPGSSAARSGRRAGRSGTSSPTPNTSTSRCRARPSSSIRPSPATRSSPTSSRARAASAGEAAPVGLRRRAGQLLRPRDGSRSRATTRRSSSTTAAGSR